MESTRTHPLLTLRALPLQWRDLFFTYVSCLGPSGSTVLPSGSTAEGSQAAVPLRSGSTARGSTAVVPLGAWHLRLVLSFFERFLLSLARPSGSTALPAVLRPKGHKRQYRSTAVLPPLTPLS